MSKLQKLPVRAEQGAYFLHLVLRGPGEAEEGNVGFDIVDFHAPVPRGSDAGPGASDTFSLSSPFAASLLPFVLIGFDDLGNVETADGRIASPGIAPGQTPSSTPEPSSLTSTIVLSLTYWCYRSIRRRAGKQHVER